MNHTELLIPKRESTQRDLIVLALLWFATVGAYYASLRGGDLEFIKENLPALGRYLLISVTAFFTFNILFFRWFSSSAYSSHGGWQTKFLQLFVITATVTGLYLIDTGENFESHGAYNSIIFLILFVPSIVITLAVMSFVKWLSPNGRIKCKRYSIVGLVIFFVWMTLSLLFYHWKWSKGLNASHIEADQGVCEFRGTNIPWIDLLPDGTQNFWTGSQTCPKMSKSYTAKIENGKVLVTGCPTTPTVTFFPNTKGIEYSQKLLNYFQISVKLNWVTTEVHSAGASIPVGVESMFVQCGEDQERELLFHTANPVQIPAIESNITVRNTTSQDTFNLSEKKPNILVIYIDALSRRHFYRKMKKTTQWLEKTQAGTDRDVLQFFRYHAVGFNTNQNSRAMYCGGNEDTENFMNYSDRNPLCPIWKPMKKNFDYSTVLITNFCEDWSSQFLGFSTSEYADHEMLAPFCHPDYWPYTGNPFGNFKGPYSILRRCLFGDYIHKHSFNYMESIIRTKRSSDKPYFMHSIFTEAHEGTGEVISTMDDDLSEFLNKMDSEKLLDDTIVVFISDHGLHMGLNFAFSENGAIEHKLPLLNIVIPTKYNKEARDKLRANEQKLVTAFDVHKTLLMFPGFRADGSFQPEDSKNLIGTAKSLPIVHMDTSLFDEISWRRTCAEARVPDDTCVCDVKETPAEKEKRESGFLGKMRI